MSTRTMTLGVLTTLGLGGGFMLTAGGKPDVRLVDFGVTQTAVTPAYDASVRQSGSPIISGWPFTPGRRTDAPPLH
jgi:hypothetical protein